MPKTKVAITVDSQILDRVDELVARREFRNRSQAIEAAITEKLTRARRTRLARECAKLDPSEEQVLAEEGLAGSSDSWPAY
ncbi:MAG: ribbon-helix-helix domain-containing protein [Candidatus Rokuibacteriota bacterium]